MDGEFCWGTDTDDDDGGGGGGGGGGGKLEDAAKVQKSEMLRALPDMLSKDERIIAAVEKGPQGPLWAALDVMADHNAFKQAREKEEPTLQDRATRCEVLRTLVNIRQSLKSSHEQTKAYLCYYDYSPNLFALRCPIGTEGATVSLPTLQLLFRRLLRPTGDCCRPAASAAQLRVLHCSSHCLCLLQ